MLKRLVAWWKSRHIRISECLAVEYDDDEIRIRVLKNLEPKWNQTVRWDNIRRVCWEDGGMMSSDTIYLSQIEPDKVVAVPTEAQGGPKFFGALCERQLFPEHVWRKALGDTSAGIYCWPPFDD